MKQADMVSHGAFTSYLHKLNQKHPHITVSVIEHNRNPRDPVGEPQRLSVKFSGGKLGPRSIPAHGKYHAAEEGSGSHEVHLDLFEKARYKAHLEDYARRGS